jgi:hypothetical protein
MVKKTRNKKRTIFAVIEGAKAERILLSKLITIYMDPSKSNIQVNSTHGGNPSSLIDISINRLNCGFDKVFVWIDEDKELKKTALDKLAKSWEVVGINGLYECPLSNLQKTFNTKFKNPILVVSQPVCVESIYLAILKNENSKIQYQPCHRASQIESLKNELTAILGRDFKKFVEENINKEMIENARLRVYELNLIIKILASNDEFQ